MFNYGGDLEKENDKCEIPHKELFDSIMTETHINHDISFIRFFIGSDEDEDGKAKILDYVNARSYYKDNTVLNIYDEKCKDVEKQNTVLLINRAKCNETVYIIYRINILTKKILSTNFINPFDYDYDDDYDYI